MRHLLVGLLAFPLVAAASPYNQMIDAAAARHGVDPYVLRAIVQVESGKHPWTINVDGEGFRFGSPQQAVNSLWQINGNPWMVKIVPKKGNTIRQFFPNEAFAQTFLSAYQRSLIASGKPTLHLRVDEGKRVGRGEARVRKLWMVNTDLGIAQINYRFHGQSGAYVQRWLDPAFNLDYAASLLAKHKRKHGNDLSAAGYYHSGSKRPREAYMAKLVPAYHKEKRSGYASLAVR